jgi:Fe2+/Zn2+ uptake regulation proteins
MESSKIYTELEAKLTQYIAEKKLRKTEERYIILKQICSFSSHFDICMLEQRFNEINYFVSRATLYNTIELLVKAGFLITHQFASKSTHYELRILAEIYSHLICTACGAVREVRDVALKKNVSNIKITRFTPAFSTIYVYGICSKCKYKMQKKSNNNNKDITRK